eukprot:872792-Lingulodinium_polyedra.AAC.1
MHDSRAHVARKESNRQHVCAPALLRARAETGSASAFERCVTHMSTLCARKATGNTSAVKRRALKE